MGILFGRLHGKYLLGSSVGGEKAIIWSIDSMESDKEKAEGFGILDRMSCPGFQQCIFFSLMVVDGITG